MLADAQTGPSANSGSSSTHLVLVLQKLQQGRLADGLTALLLAKDKGHNPLLQVHREAGRVRAWPRQHTTAVVVCPWGQTHQCGLAGSCCRPPLLLDTLSVQLADSVGGLHKAGVQGALSFHIDLQLSLLAHAGLHCCSERLFEYSSDKQQRPGAESPCAGRNPGQQ